MSDKVQNYTWACGLLREAMEANIYGSVSFHMQNGFIANAKTETTAKAPVDNLKVKT